MKTLLFILIICGIFIVVGPILANGDCDGEGIVCIPNPLKHGDIPSILKAITGLLKVIAIPLAGVMIIIGGFQIMVGMSTGEKEKKVVQGKKTITWAIIGLAIILAIDFITGFLQEVVGKL